MDIYKTLREESFEANLEIKRQELAISTWGNASAFDPSKGIFAIKPSGVEYDELTPKKMVLVDLEGKVVKANSSRLPTQKPILSCTVNSKEFSA